MEHNCKDSTEQQPASNTWLDRLQHHTRLWWSEILRGVLTLAFSILYLCLQNLVFALIYILGAYLLCDGILDFYNAFAGKLTPQRRLYYLGALVSITIGLISLLAPKVTLFLSGIFIATMITSNGIQALGGMLHAQKRRSNWQLGYGVLQTLCGLTLFLPPLLSLTTRLLVVFVGIYAFGEGLYLFIQGLRLWRAPATFTTLIHRATRRQLDIPRRLPRSTRRAMIFIRHSGAGGLGHISWAFEWRNGWFNVGGVENRRSYVIARPELADFWTAHTTDPIGTMQKFGQGYDEYKIFSVTQPRPKAAWRVVVWTSRIAYTVIRHNCVDATYDVLRMYGVMNLPDPATHYAPNDWYDSLSGPTFATVLNPTIPIHIRRQANGKLTTTETLLSIPEHIAGTRSPWRESSVRGLAEIYMILRRMTSDVRASLLELGKFLAILWKRFEKRGNQDKTPPPVLAPGDSDPNQGVTSLASSLFVVNEELTKY
jgi:uncharacterized membrane protein HdeD (DUF308 family)